MTVWFTADPHFGHAKAAELRGFASVQEHDEAVIESVASRVKPGDEVWWLGDMAFDGWQARIPMALVQVGLRDVFHHLVLGNHDRAHPMQSRGIATRKDLRRPHTGHYVRAGTSLDRRPGRADSAVVFRDQRIGSSGLPDAWYRQSLTAQASAWHAWQHESPSPSRWGALCFRHDVAERAYPHVKTLRFREPFGTIVPVSHRYIQVRL